jgi:peptidoglycan/LPS O-acetylase OafA/YrhL
MIRRLLLLNGLAVLGVVLNHTIGWGFIAMFWWANQYRPVSVPNFDQFGTPVYYSLRTIEQIAITCIPAFLFVSGFFVAIATGRNNTTIGWRLIGVRIAHLFVPYILWSLLIFIADFMLLGIQHTPLQYLKLLAVGGATSAYYYVPLLCQLYLLSPLLVLLAKRQWRLLLVLSFLIQAYAQISQYQLVLDHQLWPIYQFIEVPNWTFPGYLLWFSSGIVAGFYSAEFKQWLTKIKWVLIPLALLMLPLGVLEWEFLLRMSGQEWLTPKRMISDELFSVTIILCFLAFDRLSFPFSNRLGELGTKSYGIYLAHSMVLLWASKVIYQLEPWILGYQVLFQPILFALGVGIPLFLMAIVNRSPARRYYQYIFG